MNQVGSSFGHQSTDYPYSKRFYNISCWFISPHFEACQLVVTSCFLSGSQGAGGTVATECALAPWRFLLSDRDVTVVDLTSDLGKVRYLQWSRSKDCGRSASVAWMQWKKRSWMRRKRGKFEWNYITRETTDCQATNPYHQPVKLVHNFIDIFDDICVYSIGFWYAHSILSNTYYHDWTKRPEVRSHYQWIGARYRRATEVIDSTLGQRRIVSGSRPKGDTILQVVLGCYWLFFGGWFFFAISLGWCRYVSL